MSSSDPIEDDPVTFSFFSIPDWLQDTDIYGQTAILDGYTLAVAFSGQLVIMSLATLWFFWCAFMDAALRSRT